MLLTEKLQLLSINPQTNKPYGRTISYFPVVLSGALLGDLLVNQYVQLNGKKVVVINQQTDKSLLKDILVAMSEQEKTIKFWMQNLQKRSKDIEATIKHTFVQSGILTTKTSLFNKEKYELNEKKRTDYVLKIKAEIKFSLSKLEREEQLQPEEQEQLLLLGLIDSAKLLPILFPNNNEIKEAKKQIKKLKSSSLINKEIQSAINTIDTLNSSAGAFMMR
ncbi:MAG: GPP34 family phosphoprotein [Tetragenococcus koreensis]|nr:GPP34 family phosphoprotein [Tetragenococcus koreensis]